MSSATSLQSRQILARLDRIPVWPYSWRVPIIVGAGFFFSFFDIVSIGFALPVIIKQFGVTKETASWAITSGLIGYIAGSYVVSTLADRYGRRVGLFLSVFAFSAGSILSATSTDLGWLVFWRVISGMGIGAEISLVTTYMGELSPAPLRGRFTGIAITAGFSGFAIVPLIATYIVPTFDWGWRALFVLGGLGGVLIGIMRRALPPSVRWLIAQARLEAAEAAVRRAEYCAAARLGSDLPDVVVAEELENRKRSTLPRVASAIHSKRILWLASVWFFYYVGNYAWLTVAPELLVDNGFKLRQDYFSLSITGLGFVAGAVAAAFVSDRVERKTAAVVAAILWSISLFVIGMYPSQNVVMGVGFVASFTIGFIVPVLYTYTSENFPTEIRATAIALSDGFGHLGGAFCGQIVFFAYTRFGFVGAFGVMAATGLAAACLTAFGRRTTGRSLQDMER